MPKLTATYVIPFAAPVRVQVDESAVLEFKGDIEGFQFRIQINRPDHGATIKPAGALPVFFCQDFSVSISRDEEEVPAILPLEGGGRDLRARMTWFSSRIPEYRKVAQILVDRLIRYFKYVKRSPRQQLPYRTVTAFFNPTWSDDQGKDVEKAQIEISSIFYEYSGPSLLGEKTYSVGDATSLLAAITTGKPEATSAQEFLSDAQTSIYDGNFRRAILEMAIACEIGIKRSFFEEATAAGAAFEYLEDKSKINARAIDFLDGPAGEAFAESFKASHQDEYTCLDFLFRCRNKIAHRAIAEYRDDKGVLHMVDRPELNTWMAAVETLFIWLESKTGRIP